jgi:lipoyl(octanoyl) transferase
MAVDHALLESVRRGGAPVLRLYRWHPACLSFGRNQHTRHSYDADAIAAHGIDVVRRPTGGLAVLHDQELTYCVLAPLEPFRGPRNAYHAINAALVTGLRTLGLPAELAGSGGRRDPRRMTMDPCFLAPAEGEVIASGRKLVGSAQRCENGALLQHGSILLAGSQTRVTAFTHRVPALAQPSGDARAATDVDGSITVAELMGAEPDVGDVASAVRRGFEGSFGICLAPAELEVDERARTDALALQYADPEWTWRL